MIKVCKCPFSTPLLLLFQIRLSKHCVIQVCLPARLRLAHESVLRLNDIDTSVVLSPQLRDISRLSTNSQTGASSLREPHVCDIPNCPKISTICYQYNDWSIDINTIWMDYRRAPQKFTKEEREKQNLTEKKSRLTCWNHQLRLPPRVQSLRFFAMNVATVPG